MVTVQTDPAEILSPLHGQVNVSSLNSRIKVAVREFTISQEWKWKPLPAILENLFSNPYEYVSSPLINVPVFLRIPCCRMQRDVRSLLSTRNPDAEGRPDGDLAIK